ncbi:cache domain-containing protein [Desulfobacula sp.]|uniref:cache domain-containing protein n=1 Tax=Desulfobacula sp. TaxID=2593537 RepID=UPI0027153FF1|nr:cache domain-containing protein [Desulfobacula sp.]
MKKANPNLRTLFTILSLMAVLTFASGGYLYYSAVKKSLFDSMHQKAEVQVRDLRNELDSYRIYFLKSAKFLSNTKELKQSVLRGDLSAIAETNVVLDNFRDDIKIDVCYLINNSGNTIASSNRDTPASFVGKNYGFRPYFKQAMQGDPAVYMALGVTSKKRGIYFSHPVYGERKDGPWGVVVIKASIETIERKFKEAFDGIVLMTDPQGVVFVSSREDWLYRLLWKASSETILDLTRSKQFGTGPWNWTGMKLLNEDTAVDDLGNEYGIHQQGLAISPGWNLIYLHSHNEVMKKINGLLGKTIGISAVLLFVCFGLIVFFLFIKANTEINQRKKAELEQKLSLSRLKATLESTTDGILVVNRNGETTAFNDLFAKMWNIPADILESHDDDKALAYVLDQLKTPDEFIKKVKKLYADPDAKSFDTVHFKNGRIMERYSQPQKLDEQIIGRVWSFRDVTERILARKKRESLIIDLQNALAEVKTLKGILPICSQCKQIRDDKGYWNKIETYIKNHSAAEFSHGLCPECSDKLYGDEDWYIEMKKEDESKE